eukprot:6179287-Pleurochrysis_carterae.AAC.2
MRYVVWISAHTTVRRKQVYGLSAALSTLVAARFLQKLSPRNCSPRFTPPLTERLYSMPTSLGRYSLSYASCLAIGQERRSCHLRRSLLPKQITD